MKKNAASPEKLWAPYFWIAAAGLLLYFKAVWFGLTFLDDNVFILDYQHVLSRPSGIFDMFSRADIVVGGYYRPVLSASMVLNALLGGRDPFFYHLGNVICHIIACGLVFALLGKLGYSRRLSLFFALLFTVHPVLTNPVVWIPGRADIALAIFTFAAFIFFLDFLRSQRAAAYLRHILFFALGLLSRENAVAMPFIFLFYLLFVNKEKIFSRNQRVLAAGWSLTVLAWFLLRRVVVTRPLEISALDAVKSVWKAAPAVIQYLGRAVFPFHLSVLPTIEDTSFVWGTTALALTLLALFLSKRKRCGFVLFGAGWFLFLLMACFVRPDSASVPIFLDHRIYPAFLGLFIAALEIDFIKGLKFDRPAALFTAGVVLLCLSAAAFTHSDNYKDRMTFWKRAVKDSPHSPLARRNLGAMYYLDGFIDEAEQEYIEALRLNPHEQMVNNNLGLIYMNRNMYPQAEEAFRRELALYPDYDNAHFNLGLLYARMGLQDEAVGFWKKALEVNPDHIGAQKMLKRAERGT